jgi:dienelactone hydrolase
MKTIGMKTQAIKVKLRDGEMGAYVAIPDRTPAGAIIAIMEIWGVNDTMRRHAHEFAQAGFVCLVPDLFWRQEPGVELSDHDPEHVKKAFDLYYDFDYDLAVRDMEDTWLFLQGLPECNGKVGAVGYCLGGKLCYLMCCRTNRLCGRLLRHLYRAPHPRGQEPPPAIRAAHGAEGSVGPGRGERAPGAAAVTQSAGHNSQISRCRSCLRAPRRQDLLEAGGGAGAGVDARVF